MIPWNNRDELGNRKLWTWLDNKKSTVWEKNIVWYVVPYIGCIAIRITGNATGSLIFVAIGAFVGIIISLGSIPWLLYEYYSYRKEEIAPSMFRLALFIHLGMLTLSIAVTVGTWLLLVKYNT